MPLREDVRQLAATIAQDGCGSRGNVKGATSVVQRPKSLPVGTYSYGVDHPPYRLDQ